LLVRPAIGTNIVPGSWSPDGSRFVINAGYSGIHIWELGGSVTTFREAIEGAMFYNPVWSPDGKYSAYTIFPIQWSVIPEIGSFIDSLDGTVHRKFFQKVCRWIGRPMEKALLIRMGI